MEKKYLFNYTAINQSMYELMERAEQSIILCALIIDTSYPFYKGHTLEDLIKRKLKKGVHVQVITTSERQEHHAPYDPVVQQVFHYVPAHGPTLPFWARLITGFKFPKRPFVQHQKYLLIDNKYLHVGGCHISESYSGNFPKQRVHGKGYYLHETALALPIQPELAQSLQAATYLPPLVVQHEQVTLDLIESSTSYVYIENQYIYSTANSRNRIFEQLARKFFDAHQAGIKFRITVVGNYTCSDETWFVRKSYRYAYQASVQYFYTVLAKLGLEEKYSKAYCKFYALKHGAHNIFIHSKLLVVDGKIALLSSANLTDRSLIPGRDDELGIIEKDPKLIAKIQDHAAYMASNGALTFSQLLKSPAVSQYNIQLIPKGGIGRHLFNFLTTCSPKLRKFL